MDNNQIDTSKVGERAANGDYGMRILTGSSVSGEYFGSFTALEDSTISFNVDMSQKSRSGDTSATSLDVIAGLTIFGAMTDIVVSSGKVIAYLK